MTATANFLRRCGLFRGFDDVRLDALTSEADEVVFDAGADVFHEGDAGDAMFVVLSGAVQVYTNDREGREIILARLEAGDYFGEQALLPGGSGRRNASVRAAETARLARMPRAAFQAALAADDALRERLVEIGAEQIRNNLQQLSPLARGIGLETAATQPRTLVPGEILFKQGDEADALYFVSRGRLTAWREENGERKLIGAIERAGCVGELALLRRDRRSATVIAEEPTEVIAVPRAAFEEAYRGSAAVRERLATLQRAYELPQRGILTQHAGVFAGQDCITTLYHLNDGTVFAAYRAVGQSLYAVERLGANIVDAIEWREDERSRELRLDAEGVVAGLTARGEWPDVHAFHQFVLDRGRIGAKEREQFLKSGRFDVAQLSVSDVVCHCVNVTGETLQAAIRAGARTFTRLQEATSCGTVCGGCVPVITEMLGTEEWLLADVVAERDEAPYVRSFELVPRDRNYPEAAPGQHIVVEGLINGLRVRRPYTLSSPRRHGGRLRITVKREEGGAFSPWLFDGRPKGEPLRITRPRGEYVIDLTSGPAVCMVAGIGVTPALAAVSTYSESQQPTPFMVHYSGRERGHMPCLSELESAAQGKPVELIVRETSRQGRLDAAEVVSLASRYREAEWYLCGPPAYLHEVGRLLKQSGVPGERIHVETFTSIGTPATVAKASAESRAAAKRYLLAPPTSLKEPPVIQALRRIGRGLVLLANSPLTDWRLGSTQLNPFRGLERRFGRAAGVDADIPFEHLAIVAALSWGPTGYQIQGFNRLVAARALNRQKALRARAEGRGLPENTPDGDTFAYVTPSVAFPQFPQACRVDTGWTRPAEGKVVAVYVTRSKTALDHLLRQSYSSDRGAMPYHFVQQLIGRTDVTSCPGRKSAGVVSGQFHDNSTWAEDRPLAADMFGFSGIDSFGPGMSTALDEVCATIDEAYAEAPDTVVDLNVLLSKVAYTIIIRAVFGDVDLAEMHAYGRRLSEAMRLLFAYMWEFIMGRQSIPPDYVEAQEAVRGTVRAMIDLIRDLDRRGKLSAAQKAIPTVRIVLETANAPDGAHGQLYAFMLPLIIAGHETTGHSMSWAVYELSRQPEVEAAVLAEIETYRAAHHSQKLTTAGYDERPMAWALLAEILRRHPPFQALPRSTTSSGVVPPDPETGIGGFRYPSDAMFVFSIFGIHMDPNRWPDPYEFRIDRWLTDVRDSMTLAEKGHAVRNAIRAREQAFDWLPFGDGPGRCPGQHFNAHEFFLVLDALLGRYQFELVYPERPVGQTETMIVGPEPGKLAVRIRPRKPPGY